MVQGTPPTGADPTSPRIRNSRAFWLTLIGYEIVYFAIALTIAVRNELEALVFLLVVLIPGGLIGGLALVNRNRPVGLGLAFGALVAILIWFVVLVIVVGLCLAGNIPFA